MFSAWEIDPGALPVTKCCSSSPLSCRVHGNGAHLQERAEEEGILAAIEAADRFSSCCSLLQLPGCESRSVCPGLPVSS